MHLRLLGLFGGLAVATMVVLAACSGPNAGLISVTHITPSSSVRVLNGSPDLTDVDVLAVSVAPATPAPGSSPSPSPSPPVSTALAYGQMSAYGSVTGNAAVNVTVRPHGGSTTIMSCQTPALTQADSYTVVIAGRSTSPANSATGLQCDIFLEDPPTISTTQAVIGFHHAAPLFASVSASSQARVLFGDYSPATTPTYNTPLGSALFTAPTSRVAIGTAYFGTISEITAAPGLGVYASNGLEATNNQTLTAPTAADVYATILPDDASVGFAVSQPHQDAGNILPFMGSSGVTSYIFNVYLIDSTTTASKASLAGTLD